ncbi:putative transcriptional regulator, contains C-terminal CBS domains [Xenococcus sp. PCC 7305]|uniref:CBS domain-containing protein n=1 Tax=Xenococcus sp. PCC 7305 TaxID=102125 RepID=UPI0002ACB5CB|nr:CBS domain-containing protein [Xenococcus sp. PCC 7305]ELS03127.1 putative transcriptional regulator, contains C-terminal CBS domains [Xenococcus sp. PCC 7305]
MKKTVADIMTTNPIVVKPNTPLQEAISILAENKFSGLPVVDDAGKLVGVISESDLMWQESGIESPPYIMFLDSIIYLKNPARYNQEIHKALGQTVGEVMSDRPITVEAEQSVPDAARIMHDKKVRRLPVVDEEAKIIGIVTQGDVIKMMATS